MTSVPIHRRASAFACVLALLTVAAWAGAARAQAAATVAVTVGADPVESITTQVGVSGTITDGQQYYLVEHYKPTGGTGCGANPSADDGTDVYLPANYLPMGPYTQERNVTFAKAGDYLVCAWAMISSPSSSAVASDSKVVTVRLPHLALTLAAPPSVASGDTFQVSATVQAEAERDLYLYAIPDTGRGCPANANAAFQSDRSRSIFSGRSVVGGPATQTSNLSISDAGTWLLCGYLHYSSAGEPPQATAQAAVVVIAPPPPPPPCVVPAVIKDEPLTQTKARLAAASCSVGKVRYVASARYARGSVFKLSPFAGTSLANAAAVDVWVSSGAPCIVPALPKTRSLASAKRRLTLAGCTVGRVTHRRSRSVRRGRVLAYTKAKGTKLSPRATVGVVVSSGRR